MNRNIKIATLASLFFPVFAFFNSSSKESVQAALLSDAQHQTSLSQKSEEFSPYLNMAVSFSKDHQVNLNLVMAIMKSESAFQEDAVSRVGALGLMQLMPNTAHSLYIKRIGPIDKNLLKTALTAQPELNIILGVQYLAELKKTYRHVVSTKRRETLMIASYNAGFKRVKLALECNDLSCVRIRTNRFSEKKFLETLAKMPGETRHYLKKVKAHQKAFSNRLLTTQHLQEAA